MNVPDNKALSSDACSSKVVALCLDSDTVRYPILLGLEDENLSAQRWLALFTDAADARQSIGRRHDIKTVWVASSDSMDGINLAAALKHDNPDDDVSLIDYQATGSVNSRCDACGVRLIRTKHEFVKLFNQHKHEQSARPQSAERARQTIQEADTHPLSQENQGALSNQDENPESLGKRFESLRAEEPFSEPNDVFEASSQLKRTGKAPSVSQGNVSGAGKDPDSMSKSQNVLKPQEQLHQSDLLTSQEQVNQHDLSQSKDHVGKQDLLRSQSFENFIASKRSATQEAEALATPITVRIPKSIQSDREAYVVAVVSGSGGTGKSTVAASLALMAHQQGRKTILVDADLQFGDAAYLLGIDDAPSIVNILEEPERISAMVATEELPAVITPPDQLEYSEFIMGYMAQLLGYLKHFYDVIVVNTGAFWAEHHAQIIEAADQTLFLIDQRPSSVRACSHALALCERCGIATQTFLFLLNFCSRHALLTSIDVSCALRGAAVQELKDGGRDVRELLGAGLPQDLFKTKNAFVQSMQELYDRVFSSLAPAAQESTHSERQAGKAQSSKRKSIFLGRKRR